MKPTWRFGEVDTDGPWCWTRMDQAIGRNVLERLRHWERMRWSEIEGPENHFIELANLSTEARKRLTELLKDDVSSLFSMRVSGRRRILGVRRREVLSFLWWDPEHQVCPSPKKYT
jgi:hypothetical protein